MPEQLHPDFIRQVTRPVPEHRRSGRHVVVRHLGEVAAHTLLGLIPVLRSGNVQDATVPQFDQVTGRGARSRLLIEGHDPLVRTFAPLQADRRNADGSAAQCLMGALLRRNHHDAVDSLGREGIQRSRDVLIVADRESGRADRVSALTCRIVHRSRCAERTVLRAGGNKQPNCLRAARGQGTRRAIRPPAHVLDDLSHAGLGRCLDVRCTVEDTRHGLPRHTGDASDITDRESLVALTAFWHSRSDVATVTGHDAGLNGSYCPIVCTFAGPEPASA